METTAITNPTGSAPVPAVSEKPKVSSDFDTFLRMLTVQLQNQDPLNPIESSDYAVQLATFSGVEQQVQTNDLLRAMTAQQGAGSLAQMASWVGMEARAAAPAHFDGAALTVVAKSAPGSDAAQLLVRNASGAEVQRIDISLSGDPIEWAGVAEDGSPFPNGNYRFDVISIAAGVPLQEDTAEVYSRVSEVRLEDGVSSLILAGGVTIPAAQVTALRN